MSDPRDMWLPVWRRGTAATKKSTNVAVGPQSSRQCGGFGENATLEAVKPRQDDVIVKSPCKCLFVPFPRCENLCECSRELLTLLMGRWLQFMNDCTNGWLWAVMKCFKQPLYLCHLLFHYYVYIVIPPWLNYKTGIQSGGILAIYLNATAELRCRTS